MTGGHRRFAERAICNLRLSRLPGFRLPLNSDATPEPAIAGGAELTPAAVRFLTLAVPPVDNNKIIMSLCPHCFRIRAGGELLTVHWFIHFKTTR